MPFVQLLDLQVRVNFGFADNLDVRWLLGAYFIISFDKGVSQRKHHIMYGWFAQTRGFQKARHCTVCWIRYRPALQLRSIHKSYTTLKIGHRCSESQRTSQFFWVLQRLYGSWQAVQYIFSCVSSKTESKVDDLASLRDCECPAGRTYKHASHKFCENAESLPIGTTVRSVPTCQTILPFDAKQQSHPSKRDGRRKKGWPQTQALPFTKWKPSCKMTWLTDTSKSELYMIMT